MSRLRLGFARWRSDVPSGGNRYDDELAAGLRRLGVDVREYAVVGPWPVVDEAVRRGFAELLTSERDWLVDNILVAGAPEAIAAARSTGRRVSVLVHYFPADEIGWTANERERLTAAEGQALNDANAAIATSAWSADQVRRRYGRDGTAVAVPGVYPASPSAWWIRADVGPDPPRTSSPAGGTAPGGSPRLLWLGRITRTKDPLTLVQALARLDDLDWTAHVVGPDTIDPDYTRLVRAEVDRAGLAGRIELPGPRTGDDLESEWAATDLLVLTSRVEPYGMVVTEALARGIPSVVTAGTGAVEAQHTVGGRFSAGDDEALAAVLRRWLTDPDLRRRWRAAAEGQRPRLPTWQATAETVLAALPRDG